MQLRGKKLRVLIPGALLAALLGAWVPCARASTTIYVQNNTPFAFSVAVTQTGAPLAADKWQRGAATVAPGRREAVVRFNRDSGITDGQRFYFTTALRKDGSELSLRQQLLGASVNSHMWQSLGGPGFSDAWFDDRNTHVGNWASGGAQFRVLYRAFFTGTDDDVEYILQYAYPVEAQDADTFSVFAYNLYMRPTSLFKNGQSIRARLMPAQFHGYDALVFSEAFDDDTRAELLNGLRPEYPYASAIMGSDRGVEQDGGMIIVSRWPIVAQDQRRFANVCTGSDCQADKGVVYVKVDRMGRSYHIFGSHTQAWSTPEGAQVRAQQFGIIKAFIDSKGIPAGEPVLIAGDLNVNKLKFPDEYAQMLRVLNAECPPLTGYWASWDPSTNLLAEQGVPSEYLDYVLWSKDHKAPTESSNEVRIVRSAEEWKEYGFEHAMWDLSDHYPVYGRFKFREQFIGRFDMVSWSKQFIYGVSPNGDLMWYGHMIGIDRNGPGDESKQRSNTPNTAGAVDSDALRARVPGSARVGAASAVSRVGVLTSADRSKVSVARPYTDVRAQGSAAELIRRGAIRPDIIEQPGPRVIHQWEGPKRVGNGWQNFKEIIPGGLSSLYGLTPEGVLKWYRHDGFLDGSFNWKGPLDVGSGWNAFSKIIAAGDGVLYGIGADGSLRWYRHNDVADASLPPKWSGPNVVGSGWGGFVHVFAGGEGVIYAVDPQGQLFWYRHKGYLSGAADWEGPKLVGTGWANFTRLFSPGEGEIYAIQPNGALLWYCHDGYRDGAATWQKPTYLGGNWNGYTQIFPRMVGTPTAPVLH